MSSEHLGATTGIPHTEESQLVRRLEARDAELDQMFRTAAHDLRAPLRSIEAFTRIARDADDRSEAAEHLDRVLNAVDRMRTLLDSLLDYADAGGRTPEPEPTDLAHVVHAAMADLAVDIEQSGTVLDVGPLPTLECDPTQLQRVFANVFANTIRHAGEPGRTIAVRAIEDEDDVTITISDDGDGFDPALTEAAFEPFRRLTSQTAGQGIGLAICRRIVEGHGGTIWGESEPGVGTSIMFRLPRQSRRSVEEVRTADR